MCHPQVALGSNFAATTAFLADLTFSIVVFGDHVATSGEASVHTGVRVGLVGRSGESGRPRAFFIIVVAELVLDAQARAELLLAPLTKDFEKHTKEEH